MSSNENFAPNILRRLTKELIHLKNQNLEGIKVILNEENITDVQADIKGPDGTPYSGGNFRIKLLLGSEFPSAPPKGYFTTKIFHPNVSKSGEICVNTLKKDWNKDMGILNILLTIKCLLIAPNPESALNEEAGRLLLEDYDSYASHARMITKIHAMTGVTMEVPHQSEKEVLNPMMLNSNKSNNLNNMNEKLGKDKKVKKGLKRL